MPILAFTYEHDSLILRFVLAVACHMRSTPIAKLASLGSHAWPGTTLLVGCLSFGPIEKHTIYFCDLRVCDKDWRDKLGL